MPAYYNEIDTKAAAWLRELIKAGHIADGEVDERSIEDVSPSDLRGFTQCHFFTGIGGWSYALRLAGWPDDKPVWTGSCPCQPFSAAGKGKGSADERHLWPAFHHLIRECRPAIVFGEQVEAAIRHGWLDLVQTDMEGEGYAFGACVLGAHSIGAPHIRQRLWWVADADKRKRGRVAVLARTEQHGEDAGREKGNRVSGACGEDGGMADAERQRELRAFGYSAEAQATPQGRRQKDTGAYEARYSGSAGGMGNANCERSQGHWRFEQKPIQEGRQGEERRACEGGGAGVVGDTICGRRQPQPQNLREHGDRVEPERREQVACIQTGSHVFNGQPDPGTTNNHWRDADWLLCRDGKWRCVEPGTFPLANGIPARVVRLRGYGNAIVPQVAAEFIRACKSD